MTQEQISKLDALFNKYYGRKLAELNSAVIPAAQLDNGNYERPMARLRDGAVQLIPTDSAAFALTAPAVVEVAMREVRPVQALFRVAIPARELEVALNNEGYFPSLMDPVMKEAIARWEEALGPAGNTRYGRFFITTQRPDNEIGIFRSVNDDYLEIRFYGNFAEGN